MDYKELAEIRAEQSWLTLLFCQFLKDVCVLETCSLEELWSLDKTEWILCFIFQ